MKHHFKKKTTIVLLVLITLVLVVRMIAPPLIVKYANKYLASFSPIITASISDIDLGIIRGAYQAEGIEVALKKDGTQVLSLEEVDVSLAWRELFKGKIMVDIVASGLEANYSKAILSELKKIPKKEAKEAKQKALPVEVELFELKNSKITLLDFEGIGGKEKLAITDIQSRVTNLTPKKDFPYSFFTTRASIQGKSVIQTAGKLNLLAEPIEWDVDTELNSLELRALNDILREKLPLTFVKGDLDLYAEAKSEGGVVEGYLKPFFNDLKFTGNKLDHQSVKHWGIEVVGAIGNLMLRNKDTKSLATKIPFTFKNELNIETGEALSKTIQHGYEQKLPRGIDNTLNLE
jgi:hypothetical protein